MRLLLFTCGCAAAVVGWALTFSGAAPEPAAAPVSVQPQAIAPSPLAQPPPPRWISAELPDEEVEEVGDDALVSGTVTGASGEAVEEASLRLTGSDEEWRTFDDGSFELTVPPGAYDLEVRAYGYLPQRLSGLVLSSGEEVRGLQVTLERGLSIKGSVLTQDGPVDDAEVTVEGNGVLLSTVTEGGAFEVDGLLPGTYRVYALQQDLGGASEVAAAGAEVTLRLGAEDLRGVLVDAQGVPVPDAEVQVRVRAPGTDQPERDLVGTLEEEAAPREMACALDGCSGVFTDERGEFAVQIPRGAEVALAATVRDAFAFTRLPVASGKTRPATLRLRPLRHVRVRAMAGGTAAGDGIFVSDRAGLGIDFGEGVATEDGVVDALVPEDLPVVLTAPYGVTLEPLEALPGNLTLETEERTRHHCVVTLDGTHVDPAPPNEPSPLFDY